MTGCNAPATICPWCPTKGLDSSPCCWHKGQGLHQRCNCKHPEAVSATHRTLHKVGCCGLALCEPEQCRRSLLLTMPNITSRSNMSVTCSPHIASITERIQINGANIPDVDFQQLVPQHAGKMQQAVPSVTHFELLTALAFQHFKDKQVGTAYRISSSTINNCN